MKHRIFTFLLPILFITLPLTVPWRVEEGAGNWERLEPTAMKTAFDSSESFSSFQYSSKHFQSWVLSFDLLLETESAAETEGVFMVEVPEWNLEIEYHKVLGNQLSNTLIIRSPNGLEREESSAQPPFQPRLNTQIYVWLWRSGEETVKWIVSDFYQLGPQSGRQTIWKGNFTTSNFEVTLKYTLRKTPKDSNSGSAAATIYLSEVQEGSDQSVDEIETHPPDTGETSFFFSLSLLLFTIVWSLMMRRERAEVPTEEPEEEKKRKPRKPRKKR
ncbi:MAG: hypothetical protein GTN80_02385 [Nitrososphaeria archaeon]|nr:hypothetical protein [Nitrososphaeria archaeon]NIN52024.1 hypothetical protein [Nitrososphaeria archaeon]NIQ32486.1 hypothetical protein [Nitrososphaeria archaeon]